MFSPVLAPRGLDFPRRHYYKLIWAAQKNAPAAARQKKPETAAEGQV